MTTPAARAQDALLSFSRSSRQTDHEVSGWHDLGGSPLDRGYRVKVTLRVHYEAKSYHAELTISEERYEGGFNSQRFGFGMASRQLGTTGASRFSAKRCTQIFEATLADLRKNPQPLIDLLQEESERTQ